MTRSLRVGNRKYVQHEISSPQIFLDTRETLLPHQCLVKKDQASPVVRQNRAYEVPGHTHRVWTKHFEIPTRLHVTSSEPCQDRLLQSAPHLSCSRDSRRRFLPPFLSALSEHRRRWWFSLRPFSFFLRFLLLRLRLLLVSQHEFRSIFDFYRAHDFLPNQR